MKKCKNLFFTYTTKIKSIKEKIQPFKNLLNLENLEPGKKINFTKDQIFKLLSPLSKEENKSLYDYANSVTENYYGNKVYFRGIIEHSNICNKDCLIKFFYFKFI
jgi:biotin synthase-like enzyme